MLDKVKNTEFIITKVVKEESKEASLLKKDTLTISEETDEEDRDDFEDDFDDDLENEEKDDNKENKKE